MQSTDIRSVTVVYGKTEHASKTFRKYKSTQLPIKDGRSHAACSQSERWFMICYSNSGTKNRAQCDPIDDVDDTLRCRREKVVLYA